MQVRALVHTDVVKYLEFKAVDGSYVFVKGKVRAGLMQLSPPVCVCMLIREVGACTDALASRCSQPLCQAMGRGLDLPAQHAQAD